MLHCASVLESRSLRRAVYATSRQGVVRVPNLFETAVSGVAPTKGRMNSTMTPRRLGADTVSGGRAKTVVRFSARGGWVGRAILGAVAFGSVLVFGAPRAHAADRWETLQAIHMIENPTNSTRIGSKGELGPYQFRPSTWKMHTKKPFRLAADRQEADRVAVKHYDWIKEGLERNGVTATPYRIALAWNAGLSATVRNSVPESSHRYAERVEALANDLRRQQLVREP